MFYGFSWRGVCDRRVAVTVELSQTRQDNIAEILHESEKEDTSTISCVPTVQLKVVIYIFNYWFIKNQL